jgi:hypothetical protein
VCVFFAIYILLPLHWIHLFSSAISSQTVILIYYLSVKDTVSNSNKTRDKTTFLYILILWFVIADRVITLPVSYFIKTDGYCNFSKLNQFTTFQQPTTIKGFHMFLYINQFSDWGVPLIIGLKTNLWGRDSWMYRLYCLANSLQMSSFNEASSLDKLQSPGYNKSSCW